MKKHNDETWLKRAIAYISNEMSDDEMNAFDTKLKGNVELAERFELVKRIWIFDNEELTKLETRWDSVKQQINEELVLSAYIRQANDEKPDKTSVSILKSVENDLSETDLQKLEKIAKCVFPHDENCLITPKKDLWNDVKCEIFKEMRHSKRKLLLNCKRKPLNNVSIRKNGVKKPKFNRNVLITGIATAAAIIVLFLILFVFMPDNSTKFATEDSSDNVIPVEKEIPKILPDVVNIDDKKKIDDNADNKSDFETNVKKDKIETVENPIDDKKEVIEDKKPDKVEGKIDSEIDDDDEKKPEDVIENKTDKTDKKDDNPEIKGKTEELKPAEAQEFIYRAKYIDFDPETLKYKMPSDFGMPLTFTFDSLDNKFNAYNFNLPTKDNGFSITIDNKNNLRMDLNNDGVFEKRLTNSTYRTFQLSYDSEKSAKLPYRLKFIRNKNNWSIMPASGFVAKKAYQKKTIMLIDANINGMFNDTSEDYIQFGEDEIQVLGTWNSAIDNWVKILPDVSGQSIKIFKIVPQNLGLLRIVPEYRESVTLRWLSIKGDTTSITKSAEAIDDIMLPVGEYTILKGIVGDGKSDIEFIGNENIKFKISQNNATVVKIGGELSFSYTKSSTRDNKMRIHRKNLVLKGQLGETYIKMRMKSSSSRSHDKNVELMNIQNAYIKSENNPKYLRNLNIQSTIGSNFTYITLPKFKESGLYLLYIVEEKFSTFLTGNSVTSIPINLNIK